MDKIVNDHFLYEATADREGVLGRYTDDPEHQVVGGPDGPLRGKAAIRRFYERLFPALKGERAEPVMRLYGDDFIVDESILIGQVVDGRPFNLPGKRGHARERVWFDFDDMARQLA